MSKVNKKLLNKRIEFKAKQFVKTILSMPDNALIYLSEEIRKELVKRGTIK